MLIIQFILCCFIVEGRYLVVQNGPPRSKGQKTRIVSPKLAPNLGTACVSFWYHMWNVQDGQLRLYTTKVSQYKSYGMVVIMLCALALQLKRSSLSKKIILALLIYSSTCEAIGMGFANFFSIHSLMAVLYMALLTRKTIKQ